MVRMVPRAISADDEDEQPDAITLTSAGSSVLLALKMRIGKVSVASPATNDVMM